MLLLFNFRGFHIEVDGELLKQLPKESGFTQYLQCTYGQTLEGLNDGQPDGAPRRMIYLNRNGFLFYSVLDYLEKGQLHFSHDVCSAVILAELEYWGFHLTHLSPCCLDRVLKEEEDRNTMQSLEKKWNSVSDIHRIVHPGRAIQDHCGKPPESGPWGKRREQVGGQIDRVPQLPVVKQRSQMHDIILRPTSSILAKIYCAVVLLTIVLSVLILLLETVPSLRQSLPVTNSTMAVTPGYEYESMFDLDTIPVKWLIVLDIITTAFLTLDFFARLVLTTNKFKFLCRVITVIDIIGIVPVWVSMVIVLYMRYSGNTNKVIHILRYMALLRAMRIFRFCHVALHNKQLRIIGVAIRSSWKELLILVSIIGMYASLFGILAFYIETFFAETFLRSAFEGLYWAVITMTTVGYGDVYMATDVGRILAVVCSMVGIVVIAMTTTLLVNTFFTVYQSVQKIERLNVLKAEGSFYRKQRE